MKSPDKKIAFKVEFSRMLEILADQIYQSPLALLRENTQNAFDAILMRQSEFGSFDPRIEVTFDGDSIAVKDNGIGMTAKEIETHFWYAGRSGKNTDAARAAGVVGTFGIGALANFGIADKLTVETESARIAERTVSSVRKSELSTDRASISLVPKEPTGHPGTIVRALLEDEDVVTEDDARRYLKEFVEFVDVPIFFNGEQLSGASHQDVLPSQQFAWVERLQGVSVAGIVSGDLEIRGMASGDLRVVLENIVSIPFLGKSGAIVLTQDVNAVRTLRSGFGLATTSVPSGYRWGGVVDLPLLTPTAGREALDDSSVQLLHQVISGLDMLISPQAAEHPESLSNDGVLGWIAATKNFEYCGPMEITPRPSGITQTLSTAVEHSNIRYYDGRDQSVITTYASEEDPLIVLSRRSPRRDCERGFLVAKGVEEVDTTPRVEQELPLENQTFAHSALMTRISRILEEDYFLPVEIRYGSISARLAVLVTDTNAPVTIYLDPSSSSVAPLLVLYDEDYSAFGPFVKDFVRSTIFPRIARLVPSSTRAGAEAFLRHLRTNREWFEYELEDKADLEEILEELRAGRLTLVEATKQLSDSTRSFVEVSTAGTVPLVSVVGEVDEESDDASVVDPLGARPGIDRRHENTSALILTTESTPLYGYSCFLSLSERVQRERGDFFLQPHSTEVVWGGRKVVFIFQHHSGRFGFYYDILCPGLVADVAGGGPMVTATILTKNRTFIPIPAEIVGAFLPTVGERKRLEVRGDLLYLGESYSGLTG